MPLSAVNGEFGLNSPRGGQSIVRPSSFGRGLQLKRGISDPRLTGGRKSCHLSEVKLDNLSTAWN
jgi:hypothetical protein